MTEKLKPCPFCGGEAGVQGRHAHWIACDDCGAESATHDTAAESITAWNTRPQSDLTREGVARVVDPEGWAFADEERRDFPADPHEKIYGTPRLKRSLAKADAILAMVPGGGGWQAIESAPADVFVLVAVPGSGEMNPFVAMARHGRMGWTGMDDEGLRFEPRDVHQPTMWMPLPAAPTEADHG